ncbi:hypothetical protein [Lysobacter silvisoli]|uniref:Uncharacterized protein n=1 Tax=Lysobacter silvisoli TaxID=2293254 RepID=A0A371K2R2_9GAMM|nr:hypothetical protein [Lysobacter silvisoli]RDZ28162.1 hypothetical protein DX914_03185 [Lysobacter silvisoli]
MPTPNYAFEKRQRELAKKRKQEEKGRQEARIARCGRACATHRGAIITVAIRSVGIGIVGIGIVGIRAAVGSRAARAPQAGHVTGARAGTSR